MQKIAIIGGKLQGTEAAYLAKKAGIRTLLIDKKSRTPASGICDETCIYDVCKKEEGLIALLKSMDVILPTLEDHGALSALVQLAEEHSLKIAFDPRAYQITSSKIESDRLIRQNSIPAPIYFPDAPGPYIIKPTDGSGSQGVRKVETRDQVQAFLHSMEAGKWVAQEYLDGRSYSVEVIGAPGNYKGYEITEIHMDTVYDCKMVTAPCQLPQDRITRFKKDAVRLAELVNLHGIMDVEAIEHDGVMKILEIDARMPSQTPAAVYHATGVNLLRQLLDLVLGHTSGVEEARTKKFTAYEHYLVERQKITSAGEHIMSEAGPLTYREDFFGADEVLSDYSREAETWRGIFINCAGSYRELEKKREHTRRMLMKAVGLIQFDV